MEKVFFYHFEIVFAEDNDSMRSSVWNTDLNVLDQGSNKFTCLAPPAGVWFQSAPHDGTMCVSVIRLSDTNCSYWMDPLCLVVLGEYWNVLTRWFCNIFHRSDTRLIVQSRSSPWIASLVHVRSPSSHVSLAAGSGCVSSVCCAVMTRGRRVQ